MRSSSPEDDLFPGDEDGSAAISPINAQLEPGNASTLDAPVIPSSELSPPSSQDQTAADMMDVTSSHHLPAGESITLENSKRKGGNGDSKDEPGSGWNNKRAKEEYDKAMESVADKNFSLCKMICSGSHKL